MKFNNGMWMAKDGYNLEEAKNAFSPVIESDGVLLYSVSGVAYSDTPIGSGLLTLKISAPKEDIISVKVVNFKGGRQKRAAFEINRDSANKLGWQENETEYVATSGRLEMRIAKKGGWNASYYYDGKRLTGSGGNKALAHIKSDDGASYIREGLDLGVGENIYGLGERFTPLVKNGQSVDIWNEDGGSASEQAYKNIPFYLSSYGYGILVNSSDRVSFEIGSECTTKTYFSVPGQEMEYFVIGGNDLKEVLYRYAQLTGFPDIPPLWSFGLWLSTSFTTKYDEETVLSFIDGMIERDIPLSVFHFDCLWMKFFEWCNFTWNEETFPDPEGMLQKIHDRGIKVCVWINPYIGQKSPLFNEGYENNYFINTSNGDVWQWDQWQPGMAVVDFTNPDAVKWYQSKLETLLDMGVDSFKTDFGERIPVSSSFFGNAALKDGISYFGGQDAESMHNYYTQLYNKAVYEVIEKKRGKGEACLFARSATVGGQKYPVHWGGDCLSTYPSMAESLRGGLSFGLSGFTFWSHDIGGFESGCNPDIYMRWTQFGLLSSHSRYHGSSEYKVPWIYGGEAVDVSRKFSKLKNSLMPYIYSQSIDSANGGLPMLRPVFLEYDKDETCLYLDRQYMLGENLLVAPIFNTEGTVSYYLPAGKWYNLLTNETINGGSWQNETHGYMTLPLLARENSVIPHGSIDNRVADLDEQEICFNIFNLKDGAEATCRLYTSDKSVYCNFKAVRKGYSIECETDGRLAGFSVRLAGEDFDSAKLYTSDGKTLKVNIA